MPTPLEAPFEEVRLLDLVTDADKAAGAAAGLPFGTDQFDWGPIWERTPALATPGPPIYLNLFGRRCYSFRRELVIRRVMVIFGHPFGADANKHATRLWFPRSRGIVVAFPSPTDPSDGRGTRLVGLKVQGMGGPPDADGITLRGQAVLEHVAVEYFARDGIVVLGEGAAHDPPSGAGGTKLWDVRVTLCGRHGFSAFGRDAAVCAVIGLSASNNGGVGIWDNSDLGSTFVGCVTHANALGGYKTGNFPGADVPGSAAAALGPWNPAQAQNETVLVGSYAEDTAPSDVRTPTLVLGGYLRKQLANPVAALGSDSAGLLRVRGRGIRADNPEAPANRVFGQLGSASLGGVAREWGAMEAGVWREVRVTRPLADGTPRPTGWWAIQFNASGIGTPWQYCDTDAPEARVATGGPTDGAKVWHPNGHYLGIGPDRVYVTTGKGPPTAGTWEKGDRRLNPDPDPGEPEHWVCVASSSTAYPQGRWSAGPLVVGPPTP